MSRNMEKDTLTYIDVIPISLPGKRAYTTTVYSRLENEIAWDRLNAALNNISVTSQCVILM